MVMIPASLKKTYEFACHSAACRPPTSGGTGGSGGGSGGGSRGGGGGGGGATLINAAKAVANRHMVGKKPVPTSSPAGGGAKVVGGKVSVDGNIVSTKITGGGRGQVYKASLLAKHAKNTLHKDVIGTSKSEVARKIKALMDEDAAKGRQGAVPLPGTPTNNRVRQLSAVQTETYAKIGKVKPTDLKVSRDGTVKAKGVVVGQTTKGSDNKWRIKGKDKQSNRGGTMPRTWNTQAAVKAELARDVNAAVDYQG